MCSFRKASKTRKITNFGFWQKTQKKHEKNAFFGGLKKGAQLCGGSRRIIYCLDTRYGPQTRFGGYSGDPQNGGSGGSGPAVPGNPEFRGFRGVTKMRISAPERIPGFRGFTNPPSGHAAMHVEPRKICPGHFPDPNIDDVIMMIIHL